MGPFSLGKISIFLKLGSTDLNLHLPDISLVLQVPDGHEPHDDDESHDGNDAASSVQISTDPVAWLRLTMFYSGLTCVLHIFMGVAFKAIFTL